MLGSGCPSLESLCISRSLLFFQSLFSKLFGDFIGILDDWEWLTTEPNSCSRSKSRLCCWGSSWNHALVRQITDNHTRLTWRNSLVSVKRSSLCMKKKHLPRMHSSAAVLVWPAVIVGSHFQHVDLCGARWEMTSDSFPINFQTAIWPACWDSRVVPLLQPGRTSHTILVESVVLWLAWNHQWSKLLDTADNQRHSCCNCI